MRHAQTEWADAGIEDAHRHLTEQGRAQAQAIAQQFQAKQATLDVIYTSPAIRTLTTAQIIATQFEIAKQHIVIDPQIYAAQVHNLLAVLAEIEEIHQTMLIVGHNPSVSDLVGYLCNQPRIQLSPATLVGLQIESPSWLETSHGIHYATQQLFLQPN